MTFTLWKLWRNINASLQHQTYTLYCHTNSKPPPLNRWLSCTLIIAALMFIVPLALFISTVIGAIAAATSSYVISREREMGRFNLIATTPYGPFGVTWFMGIGAIHRRNLYQRLNMGSTWIFRIGAVIIGFTAYELLLIASQTDNRHSFMVIILNLIFVLIAFYVDHIQALTLGAVTGAIVPTLANDRISSQIGAVVYYLFWRGITLMATMTGAFVILPLIFRYVPSAPWSNILLSITQFAWFVLINELITVILWQSLQHRLHGDHQSLQQWGLPTR